MEIDREGLKAEASALASRLVPKQAGATVITLSGDLGAGKTTFVQYLAAALGVDDTVASPTFVIEKIYNLPLGWQASKPAFNHLIHIDAYRINDPHEMEALGWQAMLAEAGNAILIEWPERIADLIPNDALRISLAGSGDTRNIRYE